MPTSQARTDWTRRPLSEQQIAYAAEDVAYLEHLYLSALGDLAEQGKLDWYEQEMQSYYDLDKYLIDPATAYQRLSGGGLKIAQQYTLKALAQWREATAQQRDIPRSWVLKDDSLFDLAVRRPMTAEAVKELGVFGRKSVDRLAPLVAKIISEVEIGEQRIWNRIDPLDKRDKGICSAMMKEMAKYAKEHSVAQGLLGTRKDIEALYRHRTSPKLLAGWRDSVVGQRLLEFAESHAA